MLRSRQAHARSQCRDNFPLVVRDGENVLDNQIRHVGRTRDDDHRTFPCGHSQPKDDSAGPPTGVDQPSRRCVRPSGSRRRAGRPGRRHDRGGGRAPRRDDGAAADRGHLRQFWLYAEQGAHSLRSRDPRCGPRGRVRLSARPRPGRSSVRSWSECVGYVP
jgi:hypothetical protein